MIFFTENMEKNVSATDDKEEGTMAVAKPNTRAFRLRADKVDQFVKRNDSFAKTMERFQAHKPKKGVVTPSKGKHE